jgi:hypothetical protein
LGIKAASAFSMFVLDEPSRMLPEIATILWRLTNRITSQKVYPLKRWKNQKYQAIHHFSCIYSKTRIRRGNYGI